MTHRHFRRAAGRFPTGVTVVSGTLDGRPHGTTVNAFTTVSMDPLIIMVALGQHSRLRTLILHSGAFAVTVLSARQSRDARWFAASDRPDGEEAFVGRPWKPGPHSGAPVLLDGVGYFDCSVRATHTAGDHTVVLGNVEAFDVLSEEPPLLFHDSRLVPAPANESKERT
ncbi:flavin reductase [Streptomyces piniterrae]|uniref:Flavin reductase n=1 Tax=Streptomyces piniterrae TaxID=2571125 RepID=A0A4U0NWG2_9ACTN|nr:flavin reductase family protein [Streptomyces piniterrae]TJZ59105.1 flavin reductase [Streptomyces piniterrae]